MVDFGKLARKSRLPAPIIRSIEEKDPRRLPITADDVVNLRISLHRSEDVLHLVLLGNAEERADLEKVREFEESCRDLMPAEGHQPRCRCISDAGEAE